MTENKGSIFSSLNVFKSRSNQKSKGFYHPTLQKTVSKKVNNEAQLTRMQVEGSQHSVNDVLHLMEKIDDSLQSTIPSSLDEHLNNEILEESGSTKYNESWPGSLPSFSRTPPETTKNNHSNGREHSIEDFIEERNTTMSKFVQRFRQQPPAPRDQREQKNGKEFWWLRKGRIPLSVATSTKQANFEELDNSDVSGMQTKAEKLLEQSGLTLNDKVSGASTIIDRFSNSSTTLSRYQQSLQTPPSKYSKNSSDKKTIQQTKPLSTNVKQQQQQQESIFVQQNPWINPALNLMFSTTSTTAKKKPTPEDDILYQWRLARKMEMAAQAVEKPNPFIQRVSYNMSGNSSGFKKYEESKGDEMEEERNISNVKAIREKESFSCAKEKNSTEERNLVDKKELERIEIKEMKGKEENECGYHKEFFRNNQHLKCCKYAHRDETHCSCLKSHHGNCQEDISVKSPPVKISTGTQVEYEPENLKTSLLKGSTGVQYDQPVKLSKEQMIQSRAAPVINDVISRHLFADDCDEQQVEKLTDQRPSTPQSQRVKLKKRVEPPKKKTNQSGEAIFHQGLSTDDDDFNNDDILKDLRSRRNQVKQRLREIYVALAEL